MGDLLRRRGLKFMAVSAVVAIPAIVLLIALGWSHFNGSDSQANPDYGPLSLKFGDFGTGGYGTGGYCQGVPPPVGLLARLSSGVVSQSLLTAGYQALPAVEGAEPDLFVIRPASGGVVSEDQADSALARLGSLTVVKSAGFVLAQSQEPSLRSCD